MNMAQKPRLIHSAIEPHARTGKKPGAHGRVGICILLSLSVGLLLSCAGTPSKTITERAPETNPELLFSSGNYAQAARLWQQQALSATEPAAGALRIKAADAWLLANQPEKARADIRRVNKSALAAPDQARMNLVLADLALHSEQPDEANVLLQQAAVDLSDSDRARYDQLRARAAQMLSGTQDLSKTIMLSRAVTRYDPEQSLAVLQSLQNIPSGQLALRAVNPRADQVLTGWLDLALVIRQNLVKPEPLREAVSAWKSRHPHHPLTENEALDLWLRYRQQFTAPRKVAVLLPESGRLQAAAEAIRDGIMDAYVDNPGGAELFFLTTGKEGELATSAYFEARDLGAQWIIGPLQKPSIEALLRLPGPATPMLALNQLPEEFKAPPGMADRLNEIWFSQDAETHALAREMVRSGFRRAIVLAPESEWGDRMAKNFSDEFLHGDRQIVASSRYPEGQNDYSTVLERLLKIDESKARKQNLENILQMKLEFEPVRRNDVDVIFLAASSADGRSIRPQLRFYEAGDVPVYATGKIFSGKPNPTADQDLNGIRFPITPLQLEFDSNHPMPALASLRDGVFAPLYALGKDAWNLLPWLGMMQRDPDFRFPGASGFYHTGPDGKLLREPAFAVFSGGLPVPLPQTVTAVEDY